MSGPRTLSALAIVRFKKWTGRQRAPTPPICRADLQQFVVHLHERGVTPVPCNCWLRALNSFCKWIHEQGHTPNSCAERTRYVPSHQNGVGTGHEVGARDPALTHGGNTYLPGAL